MTEEEELKVLASVAGLKIDPAYLPGVIRNLEILRGQAALLAEEAIAPHVEPAPVFRP